MVLGLLQEQPIDQTFLSQNYNLTLKVDKPLSLHVSITYNKQLTIMNAPTRMYITSLFPSLATTLTSNNDSPASHPSPSVAYLKLAPSPKPNLRRPVHSLLRCNAQGNQTNSQPPRQKNPECICSHWKAFSNSRLY